MNRVSVQTHAGNLLSPSLQPFTPPPSSAVSSLNNMVSPTILLIIIILAIIFFISGLLHLLVRFLPRPLYRDPDDFNDATALQGPLQQLFHLHDSGVDQTFIDTLPIFSYKSIIGVKNSPFDCAVCLCEFFSEDKLRLLPKCSHAFHMDCIDTWLLSHSTCPLCRSCLLSDFGTYGNNNNCSPVVLVLESGSESSREIVSEREGNLDGGRVSSCLGVEEFGTGHVDGLRKSCEIQVNEDENQEKKEEKVVVVKLGKFKNVDGRYREESSGGTDSTIVVDGRRCFSMGSYEYVMDEVTSLKVPIKTPTKKLSSTKPSLPLVPGRKLAMSECDCESRRYMDELEGFRSLSKNAAAISTKTSSNANNGIGKSKRESFSVSKIWLRGKKKNPSLSREESSSQASSFRFTMQRNVVDADEMKARNGGNDSSSRRASGTGIARWENGGSELGCDEENQSCHSLDSQANPQSFPTRTLLWLMGKHNKVVHSSYPPDV
ncbi:RING-H2 finger protein ATL13 [Heracleum sosnowskyi]|uniref:RING-type E3 ubiquitin transferase n=1 Tax=Heracleum sosnowskyi TaxID=360622 RepID=A0AAD8N8F7_9APIA|nr:RING-H2 finger protein ATL13 [Heracleum sosnowskyi]